jgi:hypothetical protein
MSWSSPLGKLHKESTKVRLPAVGAPVQSRKRDHYDKNENAQLPLPPAEVSQTRRNPGVMESVAREASLHGDGGRRDRGCKGCPNLFQ